MRPLRYLNGRTLSPVPAEARHIKLYVIGKDVYSVARKSPLHPEVEVEEQLIPLRLEWRKLARRVGEIFGLEIYGLDVVETSKGPVAVEINDFPSFGHVRGAVSRVSDYILHIAEQARVKRRRKAMIEVGLQSQLSDHTTPVLVVGTIPEAIARCDI